MAMPFQVLNLTLMMISFGASAYLPRPFSLSRLWNTLLADTHFIIDDAIIFVAIQLVSR